MTWLIDVFLANVTDLDDAEMNNLYEAGCDDGTIGVFNRKVMITFDMDRGRGIPLGESIRTIQEDISRSGYDIDKIVLRNIGPKTFYFENGEMKWRYCDERQAEVP